jgi:phosphoribosyl-AMP cyclohydrolase
LIYFFVNVLARCRATFWSRSRAHLWQRDETSRAALSADSLE